ncbi:MAG: PIN domain-containing protein [Syntrophobacteraceae bacterium]|nr:PIN domain-containing protein [Syntrophobacteraceae bacterium]
MVSDTELGEPVCEDPDDDKFIACTMASKTNLIVSGDKHLLKVSGFQAVCDLPQMGAFSTG